MPYKARKHADMLLVCCGICGHKKKQGLLRKITDHTLMQIKCIDGYKDYNLSDDRFPKMICDIHRSAVRERFINPDSSHYTISLPSEIPPYNTISLPHTLTRASPNHTCFLCEQNLIGRPKKGTSNNPTINKCNKCLQTKGRGIPHPCLKSSKQSVVDITNTLEDLRPNVKDQVIHSMLKSKLDVNESDISGNIIKLNTSGHQATLQINPSTSKFEGHVQTETLDKIRIQANLSLNQTKLVIGGIQTDLGRKSIPPNYISHASNQIKLLKDFFIVDKQNFITETKDSIPTKYEDIWAVWAPIVPLINYINEARNNICSSDYTIKIMADTGQGKTKICFCIIHNESQVKRSRASYNEGGRLNKGSLYSGINKCIMCFCSPQIKEVNWNLNKIFQLIGMEQVFLQYENVLFTGDLKLINEIYGLMEASSNHPCVYCTIPKQELEAGPPRTIGGLRSDFEKWNAAGAKKNKCKDFNNVKNYPLFTCLPDDTPILKITPPPSLHIMLGVFNHLWKGITIISDAHNNICHEFAMRHNCVRESYWGKTFEGNECVKLLTKIELESESFLLSLPGAETHIEALCKFNVFRKLAFGNNLQTGWKESLNEFEGIYKRIPFITKPLKIHILVAHCSEFLERYGNDKGLGFYSEQTGETIHKKFEPIFNKYKIKNIHSEKYGIHLEKAVVEFGSGHI